MNGNPKDNDPVVIHLSEEAKKMQEEQGQASENETNSPNESNEFGDALLNDDDGFGAFAPVEPEANDPQDDSAVDLNPEDLQPLEEDSFGLQQKVNQLEEYARRQTADFQNYRKQVQKETSQAVEQAEDRVFSEWLEVMDNFERALTNIKEEDSPWISGMQAIFKHMLYTLERHDITPIEAQDKAFDPNWHEAISMIQDPEKENDIISQVVQTGYVRKGRLLRAARVVVVKNED